MICVLGLLTPLGYGVGGVDGMIGTLAAAMIVAAGQVFSARSAATRHEITWKQVFSASLLAALLGGLIKGVSAGSRSGHFSIVDGFLMTFMLTFSSSLLYGRTAFGASRNRAVFLQIASAAIALVQSDPKASEHLVYYAGGLAIGLSGRQFGVRMNLVLPEFEEIWKELMTTVTWAGVYSAVWRVSLP